MRSRRVALGILLGGVVLVGLGIAVERWIEARARDRVALTLGRLSSFGTFAFEDVDLVWTKRALRIEGVEASFGSMTSPRTS